MKVSFYLRRRAIWCYVREDSQTEYINTKQNINPELWDKGAHRVNEKKIKDKIKKGELKHLNDFLDDIEVNIKRIERNIRSKEHSAGFNIVAEAIKEHFNTKKTSLFDIYDEFLNYKRLEVTKHSLYKLSRVKELLSEFDKSINFDKITPLFFAKFFAFLINDKDMINNTAHKNIQFLKSFLIWSNNNGFTSNNNYKSYKGKTELNEVIYLTEEELMKLYDMKFQEGEEKLERVRDVFIFQCFTGVRFSDIENISRENLVGATWKVRTQKTHQIIEIPLNHYALSILAKYNEFEKPLPVISNQKMNEYLKELCKKAEINNMEKIVYYQGIRRIEEIHPKHELISTHSARRTFISLSLQKGMKPDVIMAITGHKTYRMMQRYLKIADTHKREEMDKAWGSPLRVIKAEAV